MDKVILKHFLNWVEENLCTGAFLHAFFETSGYSRRTMEYQFQHQYALSPGEYLFRRRMTRAAVMLRMTKLTVTEIAMVFRYCNGPNFARAFRNFSSQSPSGYRRSGYWNSAVLQAPLLYSGYECKGEVVCFTNDVVISGFRKKIDAEYISFNDESYIQRVRTQLEKRKKVGESKIWVVHAISAPISTFKSREGLLQVEILIGWPTREHKQEGIIIPAGNYVQYEYRGSWDDYAIFSRMVFLKSLSQDKLNWVGHLSFMQVETTGNEMLYKFYIPI